MKSLNVTIGKYPVGMWLALIGLCFSLLAWLMQMYSLLDWEGAIALEIQGESFNGPPVERALARVEWGVAMADMVWPLPLSIIAIIGILKGKAYGYTAGMMNFAICIYFPLFFAFQRWEYDLETAMAAMVLFALPATLGMIGLWSSRGRFAVDTSEVHNA
jgi:hydrogenase/urease accessory protein HupE